MDLTDSVLMPEFFSNKGISIKYSKADLAGVFAEDETGNEHSILFNPVF
ncbi:hypothetical protein KA977_09710 [Candidatus Dependentiae bacterium]|nr:hypothetical protein [Candidatus Dependentiae bacterium]